MTKKNKYIDLGINKITKDQYIYSFKIESNLD